MRGGPAEPSGQAQPPPTKGFTSNLNVQTTQLSKGLAPAFCYCPVLSPEGPSSIKSWNRQPRVSHCGLLGQTRNLKDLSQKEGILS